MSTAPPFTLTREQATRLQAYIQTYRHYALTSLMPSTERNATLRGLQMLQGKLIEALDQKTTPLQLLLTREEMAVLKTTITELLTLHGRQPESAERTATLGNDILDGGVGSMDWAYYNSASAGVTANLATGLATGGAGSDTLTGIENLLGSNYNDVLTGNALANTLSGGPITYTSK